MLNQKGFVLAQLLFWGAVVIIAGAAAVKNNVIPWEISIGENIPAVALSPTPINCPPGQIYTQTGCLELQKDSNQVEGVTTQAIPKPTQKPVYIDPDPIIDCNFTQTGTKKLRRSECSKSFDCQIGDKWYVYTDRNKCTEDQKNYWNNKQGNSNNVTSYPSCTVYYPLLGYSRTYNNVESSQCSVWQQQANSITPAPTTAPYQYSQEYIDTYNKSMQEINKDWKPAQFVAPTQKCYATWDDYFSAHPNYAPQNIKGMSGTPPCD